MTLQELRAYVQARIEELRNTEPKNEVEDILNSGKRGGYRDILKRIDEVLSGTVKARLTLMQHVSGCTYEDDNKLIDLRDSRVLILPADTLPSAK